MDIYTTYLRASPNNLSGNLVLSDYLELVDNIATQDIVHINSANQTTIKKISN